MKYKQLVSDAFLLWVCIACSGKKEQAAIVAETVSNSWGSYYIGKIDFKNLPPEAKGLTVYAAVISDPEAYITKHACKVAEVFYFTPEDSIPGIEEVHYILKEYDGVPAKDKAPPSISIVYGTKWIGKSFANNNTARVDYKTRGVLCHEPTHGFQLELQGIGNYGTSKTFWIMIEGVADAVKYLDGGFTSEDRPKGGHHMDGHRTTGFFLVWLTQTESPDLLRKFNRSTLEVTLWSFDGDVKYALGNDYGIGSLWKGHMATMEDEA